MFSFISIFLQILAFLFSIILSLILGCITYGYCQYLHERYSGEFYSLITTCRDYVSSKKTQLRNAPQQWIQRYVLKQVKKPAITYSRETSELLTIIDDFIDIVSKNNNECDLVNKLRLYASYECIPFTYRLHVFFIYVFYYFNVKNTEYTTDDELHIHGGFVRDSISAFFNFTKLTDFSDLALIKDINMIVSDRIFRRCQDNNKYTFKVFYNFMTKHGFKFTPLQKDYRKIVSHMSIILGGKLFEFDYDIVNVYLNNNYIVDFDVNNLMCKPIVGVHFLELYSYINILTKTPVLLFYLSKCFSSLIRGFSEKYIYPKCIPHKDRKLTFLDLDEYDFEIKQVRGLIPRRFTFQMLVETSNDVVFECIESIRNNKMHAMRQKTGIFRDCVNVYVSHDYITSVLDFYLTRCQKMYDKGYQFYDDLADTFLPKYYDVGECILCDVSNMDYDDEVPMFLKLTYSLFINYDNFNNYNDDNFICISCYKDYFSNYYPSLNIGMQYLTEIPIVDHPYNSDVICKFKTISEDNYTN